ncbi:sensor histidine kinase [Flavitalea antarctica]
MEKLEMVDYTEFTNSAKKLRFSHFLEQEYLQNYFVVANFVPIKLILASSIYLVFGVLDFIATPVSIIEVLTIRALVGVPFFIFSSILYIKKIQLKRFQLLFSFAAIAGGLGLVVLIGLLEPGELGQTHYPAGLMLVIIFACSGIGLRFWYALTSTIIILVAFNIFMFFPQTAGSPLSREIMIIHNFNLIGGSLLSLFACYSLEAHTRVNFLNRKIIEIEKLKLNSLVKELESKNIQIQQHQKEIEAEKINTLKAEYDRQLASLQLKSLRDQMNPHFLFNCMNTIEAYIMENRAEEAIEFLQKFSKLIRITLENSQHDTIPISREIQTLELYIQLEEVRANFRFSYKLEVDQALYSDNFTIPPLLIQPFVENAILHGLRHKAEGKGLLLVKLYKQNGHLTCLVEDNGVGRRKAAELQSNRPGKRESLGMKFTSERMAGLSEVSSLLYQVAIFDLNSDKETGTKVELTLPLIMHHEGKNS